MVTRLFRIINQNKMKSVFRLFLILFALASSAILISSCSEDWEEDYLLVDKTSFNVGNSGETVTISIRTNTDWRVVTNNASWVTFDKAHGSGNSELQITIGRNSSNKRTGKVTICAGTEYVEIEIDQAASTSGALSVSTGTCTITRAKSGSSFKYTITAKYTISGGHLASEAGVMFGNTKSKTTGTISNGTHTATITVTTTNPSYSVTYRAYAVNKSSGATVYGTSKNQRYN